MNNSESIQPNEWNVYSVNLAENPAIYGNAPEARTKEESDPLPVLTPTSEDETATLAFSNH